jgi:hypothetical protein
VSATDRYLEGIIANAARGDGAALHAAAQFADLSITCKIVKHPKSGANRVYWQCNGRRVNRAGLKYLIERKGAR